VRHLEPGGRIAWPNFPKTIVERPVDAWIFTGPGPADAATYFAEALAETGVGVPRRAKRPAKIRSASTATTRPR
jgi:hypothetical protein